MSFVIVLNDRSIQAKHFRNRAKPSPISEAKTQAEQGAFMDLKILAA